MRLLKRRPFCSALSASFWAWAGERVAQLVEHLTFNQRVSGSNPDALTIKINRLSCSVRGAASQKTGLGSTWEAKAGISCGLAPRRDTFSLTAFGSVSQNRL
jgi:hypothetical protein